MYRPILLSLLTSLLAHGEDDSLPRLVPAFPNLVFEDNASAAAVVPDDSGRVVVGLQRGMLKLLPESSDASEATTFLDLREKMKEESDFEEGIHGIAFHPDFRNNRKAYLSYSQRGPRRTVISEFTVPAGAEFKADPTSERIILEYPHPLGNHWGGGIVFGNDGLLYIAIGDGGLRDDPYRLSQNLWSLHGKILRIDVGRQSRGLAYGIPDDNPFVNRQEIRDEIWAYGFRNPWGISIDRLTGNLWCADVGQDKWEEVNLVRPGANYGWSERDGPERFATRENAPEEGGPFVEPYHAYQHSEGISITGGFVYRGKQLPSLIGHYLFADWGTGKIWAIPAEGKAPGETPKLLFAKTADNLPQFVPTVFIADASGEPLLFSHAPSVIYTLKENRGLAASDEVIPEPEESLPMVAPDEPELPGEIAPDEDPEVSI